MYRQAVADFFEWSEQHDTAVTFLISNGSYYSSVPRFLECEQRELTSGNLSQACLQRYCLR